MANTKITSANLDTLTTLTVDNITIDGQEIDVSSGDLTLDVAADIILDAGGNEIKLKTAGTEWGQIYNSSSDLAIYSSVQDKDIKLQGNDGGSVITALTLDMSNAGRATFNENVTVGGNLEVSGADVTITSNIIHAGDTNTFFGFNDADTFRIVTGGSERIRILASGDIGYSGKLFSSNATNTLGGLQLYRDHSTGNNYLFDTTTSPYHGALIFGTSNTEVARFDTSGRLGIGTASLSALLHLSGNSDDGDEACQIIINDEDSTAGSRIPSIQFKGNNTNIGRIRSTDTQGILISGSSANADDIVIQENKIGIGTNSPARNLSINATSPVLQLCNSNTGTSAANGFELAVAGDTAYIVQREDANLQIHTNDTERMRIDGSGLVSIGNDDAGSMHSNANKLVVGTGSGDQGMSVFAGTSTGRYAFARAVGNNTDAYDGGISYDGNRNLGFHTNANTERMRIDGSGTVSIPGTAVWSSGVGHVFTNIAAHYQIVTSTSVGNEKHIISNTVGSGGAVGMLQYRHNGSVRGDYLIATYNDGVYFASASDYRFKENINTITDSYLTKLTSLRPITYTHKASYDSEDSTTKHVGFIAHEVQEVFPEFVDGTKDAVYTQEDLDKRTEPTENVGDPLYQTVAYSRKEWNVYIVKALQELKAENEALKARITTLEG